MNGPLEVVDVPGVVGRMTTAANQLDAMGDAIDARGPWPAGPVMGDGPESEWGPPEVLAHLAEMMGYWLDQMERVIGGATAGGAPVAMGRMPSDPGRAQGIEGGRRL